MVSRQFLLGTSVIFALMVVFNARPSRGADSTAPRLVILVSVDQLAYEYLERFDKNFTDEGIFRRTAARGAWFTNCHHWHAFTYTAPGHTVQLTGCYAPTHGIIDNDWFDRRRGKLTYCVFDPDAKLIGTTGEDPPVSPRPLLADTLGDRMKLETRGRSKVFGVAIKDRAAILMAGRMADAAYWMSNDGNWITSDFYRKDLPGYLRHWNESRALRSLAGKQWRPLYDLSKYRHGKVEDSTDERAVYGMTKDFPHVLAKADDPNYIRQLAASPFGNDVTLAMARDVVAYEKLGQDEFPDLLAINLSSNDYVGHMHGPYSLEVEDMTYRTDLALAALFDDVAARMKDRRWLMVITADHGVSPIPEWAQKRKLHAKRNPLGEVDRKTYMIPAAMERLETHLRDLLKLPSVKALAAKSGDAEAAAGEAPAKPGPAKTAPAKPSTEPRLVLAVIENQVYLNWEHPALPPARAGLVQRMARDWLLDQEGVALAMTREQLLSGGATTEIEQMVRRSFHARRSGDVIFVLDPYHFHGEAGTSHGSPYHYDTHVPLLLLDGYNAETGMRPEPGMISQGRFDRRVSPAAIAPTLAKLLGIDPPSGCVEEPLREAVSEMTK